MVQIFPKVTQSLRYLRGSEFSQPDPVKQLKQRQKLGFDFQVGGLPTNPELFIGFPRTREITCPSLSGSPAQQKLRVKN